ncbi:hypothetical protein THAOC_16891 [Thalassiosira oceanica]|uniref:Uncharacterized protein n=1 Tax=Thalassiosira oceanica TaxID=159749 RepID=K0SC15_THAOC|nr:hypothetical protein THAOC_16891 [Thalassiosira oceanica]|eukprot:EJK62494.1 hypothetical protein THAOC_16891 [Thalassiosira oceanica]
MFTTLFVFLVSLWAGLMTLSSSAWMNPSVAFAVECVAILAFAAIPVVVLLALIRRLLRFAVDLIHHQLGFALDLIHHLLGFALGQIYRLPGVTLGQIYRLPGVTLSQIYRLSGIAATLFGRVRAPANHDPTLTPLSDAHDNGQPVRTPTSDGCDLSLTSVSASLNSVSPRYTEFPTLEDAFAFEEKCLCAEDKEPTLLNDERATAELTVAEPEPPTNQNPAAFDSDYDFDPFARNMASERQESESLRPPVGPQQPVDPQPPAKPLQFEPPTVAQNDLCVKDLPPMEIEDLDAKPTIAPTPLRRSERLMRKKAKAAVFKVPTPTSKMIGQPRREKSAPAQSAEPPATSTRIPRSKSTAVGLQSEKAVPSAHLRRSTRARRKPTKFSP